MKNIMAAGAWVMRTRGRDIHLVEPELIVDSALRMMPLLLRIAGRANRARSSCRFATTSARRRCWRRVSGAGRDARAARTEVVRFRVNRRLVVDVVLLAIFIALLVNSLRR